MVASHRLTSFRLISSVVAVTSRLDSALKIATRSYNPRLFARKLLPAVDFTLNVNFYPRLLETPAMRGIDPPPLRSAPARWQS